MNKEPAKFDVITGDAWRRSLLRARKRRATAAVRRGLKPGEPCGTPGCVESKSEPCRGCGRVWDINPPAPFSEQLRSLAAELGMTTQQMGKEILAIDESNAEISNRGEPANK